MNSCWLPLVHTLALLRTWPCTLSYGIFSYTQPHTHTHMYSVLAHTSYTCGKQYTCLMMVQTLSLTNIVICTCTCILFNSADCISICVPSLHNTHMHMHRHTHTHDIHTQTHTCTHTHMTYTHRHTNAHTDTLTHTHT